MITLIKSKQIQGLEELENNALVSVEQEADGTVTLTRSDGFSLSFAAGDGTAGEKGDKGSKGDKGADGLSAYELTVLQGYHGSEKSWRQSFKGDKGDPGVNGTDGKNGSDGAAVMLADNVTVNKGVMPAAAIGQDNNLIITLPDIKEGETGVPGQRYQINNGVVTEGENFAVDTLWDDYDGTLKIVLPVSKQGNKGTPGVAVNKNSPTLDKVTVGTILIPGAAWQCTGGGRKDQNGYTFDLAPAADGLQGPAGKEGLPGAAIGDLDITDQDPAVGFAGFFFTNNSAGVKFVFDDDSHAVTAFDISSSITFVNENHNLGENEA